MVNAMRTSIFSTHFRHPARLIAVACLVAPLLAACGGGGGGGSSTMNLGIADGPVESASSVVVSFTGVELQPSGGGQSININFSTPKTIDLVQEQNGNEATLLSGESVPAGNYDWMRLMLNVAADGTVANSYITINGAQYPLVIPSGAETGLKLVSGFTVTSSGVVDYTIDFDLRKAITCPPGQAPVCTLKPTEKLVDNTTVGNIQGVVDNTLVPGGCTPGVYLYNGTVSAPEDINSAAASSDTNQPIASKVPVATSQPPFYYQFTFLPPGTYTVAFTCQAGMDNPDQADSAVTFNPIKSGIAVAAKQTVTVDFP